MKTCSSMQDVLDNSSYHIIEPLVEPYTTLMIKAVRARGCIVVQSTLKSKFFSRIANTTTSVAYLDYFDVLIVQLGIQ